MAEQGYEVVGVTMQLYDHGAAIQKANTCCAGKDIHDARRVADSIGIPHYVVDYEGTFLADVMEQFADSYVSGETPVPCVLCNQTVKFRDLLTAARDLGADALATGHYVRRVMGDHGPQLHRGADPGKDQSYFLFATTAEQLEFLRFPLGGLSKVETRALARRYKLPTADKAESQDICFVPDGDYARVVEKLRPGATKPGDIVHVNGDVLGRHDGIIHYTIGQRRGIDVGGMAERLYVVRLDPVANRVIVGPRSALGRESFAIRDLNWLGDGDAPPAEGVRCMVKHSQQLRARRRHGASGRTPWAGLTWCWTSRYTALRQGRPASSMTASACLAVAGFFAVAPPETPAYWYAYESMQSFC